MTGGIQAQALQFCGEATAVLSAFAFVGALSFDAFQLSGASSVIPFPFGCIVLHRRRALKADESFVAILHRIHVITVTMRGVAMNVVHVRCNTFLTLQSRDFHRLAPSALGLAYGDRVTRMIRHINFLLSIRFAALRRSRDLGLGGGKCNKSEHNRSPPMCS